MIAFWNSIKNAEYFRKKIGNNPKNRQSRAMYHAFSYVRILLIILGRLPMQIFLKEDGTYAYRYKRTHIHVLIFYFTSGISIGLVFMMTLGIFTLFLGINKSNEVDNCGNTWEYATLFRQLVPVMVIYSQLLLTAIGSVFIFVKGEDNVHYFNYWNRALEMMDMDISKNSMYYGLKAIFVFLIVIFLLCVLYGLGVPTLHETSGVIASLITRLFIVDIYKGEHKPILAANFEKYKSLCKSNSVTRNDFIDPPERFKQAKLFGFCVQLYAMYSSRTFIMQFKFFCHALGNCATIWNERLKNTLHGIRAKADDQCRKRLNVSSLLKDHLIIVQLFRLTQITYYVILITYFAILGFNLIFQGHYIPLIVVQENCVETWIREMKKANTQPPKCKAVDDMKNNYNESVTFQDPCRDERLSKLGDVLVASFWLGHSLLTLYDVSADGTYAHEQAMQGWNIMRRHMFMWTSSKEQRNFVYSMINSLSAHNNPIWITLSGYYNLSRIFVVELLACVLNFVINAVQFKPFVITLPRELQCYDMNGRRVKSPFEVDD